MIMKLLESLLCCARLIALGAREVSFAPTEASSSACKGVGPSANWWDLVLPSSIDVE